MTENQLVCPMVLRKGRNGVELLALHHPEDGNRFVTGAARPGEAPEAAARRELRAASGIAWSGPVTPLGTLTMGTAPVLWHVFLIVHRRLPDDWSREAKGEGRATRFFWQPISRAPDDRWHPDFRDLHKVLIACEADLDRLVEAAD